MVSSANKTYRHHLTEILLKVTLNNMYISRRFRILKYWLHILLYKSKVVYDVHKLLYNDVNNGKTNWVSNVRDLLFSLGFNYVRISQDASSVSFDCFKQRIID